MLITSFFVVVVVGFFVLFVFYARLCPAQFSAMLGFGKRVAEKGGAN